MRRGAASPYRDWFYHLEFPVVRPESGEPIPGYECFGYERTMPKLDTANAQVRDYLCRVGEHWVRAFDIDGWRLDVASEIDDGFWHELSPPASRRSSPIACWWGEVWETARHWLNGDMFDSTMNYDFRKHARRFFAEESIDARAFAGRCGDMLMRYRKQMIPAQLNLLDSHDVSRFLSLCGGDVRRYRLAALFQLTFPGMPSIFYGDELGAMGVREEEYRRAMPWADGDVALWDFFPPCHRAARRAHAALRGGSFRVFARRIRGTAAYLCPGTRRGAAHGLPSTPEKKASSCRKRLRTVPLERGARGRGTGGVFLCHVCRLKHVSQTWYNGAKEGCAWP